MVFNNKETVISNITCNGKLKEHHWRFSDVAKLGGAALKSWGRVVMRGVRGVGGPLLRGVRGGRREEGGRGRKVRVGLGQLREVMSVHSGSYVRSA